MKKKMRRTAMKNLEAKSRDKERYDEVGKRERQSQVRVREDRIKSTEKSRIANMCFQSVLGVGNKSTATE